jgi:uncharacterized protein
MTQPAKSQEPSMEEILASIRRIIADDDAVKSTQRPAEQPKVAAAPPRPAAPPPAPPPAPRPVAVAPRVAEPAPPVPDVEPDPPEPAAKVETDSIDTADLEDQSADILDLTESMAASATLPASDDEDSAEPSSLSAFRTIDGNPDVGFDEAVEKPAQNGMDAPRRPFAFGSERGEERERLMSGETSAAVDSAFNTLAQTVLVQNARTLEDLVREMLRPLLKSWLDDNLPALVERLVRAEIERVSRGR